MAYKIVMPYIGGILTDNNYKIGKQRKRTHPMVRMWMNELAEKVREQNIPKANFYEVGLFGHYYDERRPDNTNLFKVLADALKAEDALDVDDKWFRLSDKGYELGYFEQELIIEIEPKDK